jgi:YkoY family integral membrane protein
MTELFQQIIAHPLSSLLVIGNLILIESLLSVDNAAVLAAMVMDLPVKQRYAALQYGILGAYLFRGICLFFAAYLVKVWWLKLFGGLYLLYLFVTWFRGRKTPEVSDDHFDKQHNRFYSWISGRVGPFVSTIFLVELMDLAFSIDNIFAAVAFTDNIILIYAGVFIGILAMRFVARGFISLMESYPFLKSSAFIVIGLLGIKLSLASVEHLLPDHPILRLTQGHAADIITSVVTVAVFLIPVITSTLFNIPARKKPD